MKAQVSLEKFLQLKKGLKAGQEVKIITGSMEPFISVGQKIKIAPFCPKSLKRFDTLVFWQKEKFICHFFYKTDSINGEKVYFTKALNARKLDVPFKEEHILGIVTDPKLPNWKRFFMRWIF